MQDIDFIPVHYRQKHIQRQSQLWRIVVVVLFAALLGGAAFIHHDLKRRVEQELATITSQYELAVSQNAQLAEIQSRLKTARTDAELFTYLRHPWPRTQLLAALLIPLPEEVTLKHVQIHREMPQDKGLAQRRTLSERRAEGEADAKLLPAARDLKRLRDEFDKMKTVVFISGTTNESAALHGYLGKLDNASLFAKAELDSIESAETSRDGLLEFNATLVVLPGYGQPHGPTAPEENALAQTKRQPRQETAR